MKCEICNEERKDDRLVATIYHFFARLCEVCKARYGERDEQGQLVYGKEAKHAG